MRLLLALGVAALQFRPGFGALDLLLGRSGLGPSAAVAILRQEAELILHQLVAQPSHLANSMLA